MPLEIKNVQPGVYAIKIQAVGRQYVASAKSGDIDLFEKPLISVDAKAPAPIEIVLRDDGGSIEGRVFSNGQPIERASIVLSPTAGKRSPLIDTTTRGGHFSLAAVPPGEYELYAFDNLKDVEYSNRAVLATFSSGAPVHIEPNGRIEIQIEMITIRGK